MKFKIGSRYLAHNFLRHRPWWGSEAGYEVFEEEGVGLYTIDGDGDVRDLTYLDPLSEVIITLENE